MNDMTDEAKITQLQGVFEKILNISLAELYDKLEGNLSTEDIEAVTNELLSIQPKTLGLRACQDDVLLKSNVDWNEVLGLCEDYLKYSEQTNRSKWHASKFRTVSAACLVVLTRAARTVEWSQTSVATAIYNFSWRFLMNVTNNLFHLLFDDNHKSFRCSKVTEKPVVDELSRYIAIGQKIRNDKSYEGTPYDTLEKILVDKPAECGRLYPSLARLCSFHLRPCSSFIALAAPILEGKTQSAFVLDREKPLYFPLNQFGSSQPIYSSFVKLAKSLNSCAYTDVCYLAREVTIEPSATAPYIDNSLTYKTSVSYLTRNGRMGFWCLGFLKALAEHMKAKSVAHPQTPWMELLASDMNFYYTKASLKDLSRSNAFDGLCLFLDEFMGFESEILLLNLARAVGLNCIISNTNAKIANASAHIEPNIPVVEGRSINSIVFCKFNPAVKSIIDGHYMVSQHIDFLSSRVRPEDRDLAKQFLNLIFDSSLKRAGTATFFAETLNYIAEDLWGSAVHDCTFGSLADRVILLIRDELCRRMQMMDCDESSFFAKIGLSFLAAFENFAKPSWDRGTFFNRSAFLSGHLYHLTNPQNIDSPIFFTFLDPKLRANTAKQDSRNIPLEIYDGYSCYSRSWTREITYFNQEDLCTLMVCLFVPLVARIGHLLNESSEFSKYIQNGIDSRRIDGTDRIEIFAAAIVTESSRHPHVNRKQFSFKGQDGLNFLRNCIRNLESRSGIRFGIDRHYVVALNAGAEQPFDVINFLEDCRVPFLYSWDHRIRELDRLNAPASDFYVSTLKRHSNLQDIYSVFPFLHQEESYSAVCVGSNYRDSITVPQLKSIISKTTGKVHDARLSLIFCKELVTEAVPRQNKRQKTDAFHQFCVKKGVNVYRVVRRQIRTYQLEPFDASCTSPKLICVIFETDCFKY